MSGDSVAFRKLVESHQHFVHALAYRFLRDADDARDASQEVFVRLWKNMNRYKPEIKLSTWLYRITTNYCLDQIKLRGRKKNSKIPYDDIADPVYADRELLQKELTSIAMHAAEQLSPKQRAVFILRDLEELTMEEIGDVLEMDAGSVKSNLYYARKKIAERIMKIYQLKK